MNLLRIADISDDRLGGMSRYIHFVSDELRARGHTIEHAFHAHIPCQVTGRLRRFALPRAVVRLVRERLQRGYKYDAVEIHEPIAAGYAFARRFDRSLPPLIVCVYGLEARARATMFAYSRKKGLPVKWKHRIGSLPVLWQANYALRNADHIAIETEEDADYLRSQLHVPSERISFLHGAASPSLFDLKRDEECPPMGILFIATWIERKGILDLVPAIIRVLKEHPTTPVTLAGVRVPTERVLACFPHELHHRIRVVPLVDDDKELARILQGHRIFLLPSVFEGQPLSLLEAAAAGLAIVTTNTCGMKDFIRHGENGMLVEPGDLDALTAHTLRLIEDPALGTRLGAAAREKARKFSWKRSADQFLSAASAAIAHAQMRT